ncbi:MAG: amino acid adenylation domain-containing protein [Candidatus Aminicenantes bacterium]
MDGKPYSIKASTFAGDFSKEREYWLNKLSGDLQKTGFPYGHKKPVANEPGVDVVKMRLTGEIFSKLKKISGGSDARLHMILAAGLIGLLNKYTGNTDIMVGVPIYKQETEGEFINTVLVLRNTVPENKTFKELLLEVNQALFEAAENQNYPIESLLYHLDMPFDESGFPLFDTAILLENIHDKRYLRHINLNMIFSFLRIDDALEGTIEYNSLKYERTGVERIISHFSRFLHKALFNVNIQLSDTDILSEEEKNQLLTTFNDTEAGYPADKTIVDLFEEQLERTPDNTAVHGCAGACIHGGAPVQITYRELNERSNQLAHLLRQKGVPPGTIVAIMAEPSIEMIIGILGILKAGGAYLPIEPDYPGERLNFMLTDSSAKVLLTTPGTQVNINYPLPSSILSLNSTSALALSSPPHPTLTSTSDLAATSASLAYIIYTSGTTGTPKGAMIEHGNVVRLLFNDKFLFDFNSSDVWTLFHSYCFDFSIWEMYGALLYGGKLVVVSKMAARDPRMYLELLKKNCVTVLNQTPSAFYMLMDEDRKFPGKELYIKYVIFGGEAINPVKLKEWKEKYPGTKLINMFGITETTVHVTYKEISDKEIELNISNIGKPIPTLSTYILYKNSRLVPIGVAGELYVGGEGVGRGYLNRSELTREKFGKNPYKHGERLYRSGDLARWLENGEMEYLGRIDSQVKIRGYRIELGEIENRLLDHDDIKEAVVIAREEKNGDKNLCAYFVSNRQPDIAGLREYLCEEIPNYMIPSYFFQVEKIPLTANEKIDKKKLQDIHGSLKAIEEYVAPTNKTEKIMAEIWENILGVEKIGIRDDFFNAGGDSIKAIRLINSINEELNAALQLVDLYYNGSIKKLADKINQNQVENESKSNGNQYQKALAEIDNLKRRIMGEK